MPTDSGSPHVEPPRSARASMPTSWAPWFRNTATHLPRRGPLAPSLCHSAARSACRGSACEKKFERHGFGVLARRDAEARELTDDADVARD
jgi:hypothetical protein